MSSSVDPSAPVAAAAVKTDGVAPTVGVAATAFTSSAQVAAAEAPSTVAAHDAAASLTFYRFSDPQRDNSSPPT